MLLINAGCKMVVYDRSSHRKYGGEDLLDRAGIPHGSATEMSDLLRERRKRDVREEEKIQAFINRATRDAARDSQDKSAPGG
jgi:hypothetical protein